jgi:hypothetical protein
LISGGGWAGRISGVAWRGSTTVQEMHMRLLAAMGLLSTAAVLAGCQITPPAENRFSSPIFTDFGDVMTWQDRDRPPYILSYPDETMFFYPIYGRPFRSDLNLRAMSCSKAKDGTLIVSVKIQNMGADIIPPREQLTGDVGSFRVVALVTWSGGTQQEVGYSLPIPMGVSATFSMDLAKTRYFAQDVQRIDVLVDPDQVVPDPVRQNNRLTWQGTMNGDSPSCDVVRT